MPNEQPNNQYIEKAKLADLSEEMKNLQSDPSHFDEDALKKKLRDRLDNAIGKVQLNDRQFRQYQEAIAKIDESIVRLREIRDYALAKAKLVDIEKYVQEGGLRKGGEGIKYQYYVQDYKTLIQFKNASKPSMVTTIDYLYDKTKIDQAMKGLGELIKVHYRESFKSLGVKEEQKVKSSKQAQNMTLLDYMDFEVAVEELAELLREKGQILDKWGDKDTSLDALAKKAENRLMEMSEVLIASRSFLNPQDRFALANYDRASQKKGKVGREAQNEALVYRAMLYNKQKAERNRISVLASNNPNIKLFKEAVQLSAEAEKVASTDQQKAGDLYREAYEAFAEARPKKGGPSKSRELPEESDQRLADNQ